MSVEYQTDSPATPGRGTTIATDQVAGSEYQKVKIAFGADGEANDIYNGFGLPVRIASPTTAFGEMLTASMTPVIQSAPVYDYLPANFRNYTAFTGSSGVESGHFYARTGTTIYGYGAVQSFRSLNYRPGQGALTRMTGRFATGGI